MFGVGRCIEGTQNTLQYGVRVCVCVSQMLGAFANDTCSHLAHMSCVIYPEQQVPVHTLSHMRGMLVYALAQRPSLYVEYI